MRNCPYETQSAKTLSDRVFYLWHILRIKRSTKSKVTRAKVTSTSRQVYAFPCLLVSRVKRVIASGDRQDRAIINDNKRTIIRTEDNKISNSQRRSNLTKRSEACRVRLRLSDIGCATGCVRNSSADRPSHYTTLIHTPRARYWCSGTSTAAVPRFARLARSLT